MRLVLGAALSAALLVGCGGEADIPAIEQEIQVGIRDQLDTKVTVDCPDQIDWEPGGEFHCFAETAAGDSSRITVSMENDDGEWSWVVG